MTGSSRGIGREITRVILYLGSGWNTFVNGEVIAVSGGVQQ